jgi:hypothetical protein
MVWLQMLNSLLEMQLSSGAKRMTLPVEMAEPMSVISWRGIHYGLDNRRLTVFRLLSTGLLPARLLLQPVPLPQ